MYYVDIYTYTYAHVNFRLFKKRYKKAPSIRAQRRSSKKNSCTKY